MNERSEIGALPTETKDEPVPYRLAVIVTDCAHLVHAGGDVVREVRTFPLPDVVKRYIHEARKGSYCQITLALDLSWVEGDKP